MALKEYSWTFRLKATVSRFNRADYVSKVPTIVKQNLEQNATKQGKYLRVMGDPKVRIISVKPHAPILGLYGHEEVLFEITTRIRASTSPAIIITTAMIIAIIAVIKVAIIAVALVLVFQSLKEIAIVTAPVVSKMAETPEKLVAGITIPAIAVILVVILIAYYVWLR